MKYRIALCALLLACGARTQADALRKEQISPDAKWLVHIDCDNLRQTQVGDYLLNTVLAPKITGIGDQLKINVTNILQRIHSLTAYGSEFKKGAEATGVLMVNSDTDTQKVLVGALAAQILANTNGPVKELQSDGQTLYSFANQVFIAPQPGGPIVISKAESQIEVARDLLAGKGPSLASTKTFRDFPAASNSFLYVGVAEALSLPNPLPAHAKVLQMADGGCVVLGEKDEHLFLDVALHGKTAEVSRQIQQVIEGMMALVTLSQPDNLELTDLAKSTKVSSADQLISVRMEYPSSKAIARLNDQLSPKPQKERVPHQKVKAKAKQKKAVKPEAEEETE